MGFVLSSTEEGNAQLSEVKLEEAVEVFLSKPPSYCGGGAKVFGDDLHHLPELTDDHPIGEGVEVAEGKDIEVQFVEQSITDLISYISVVVS